MVRRSPLHNYVIVTAKCAEWVPLSADVVNAAIGTVSTHESAVLAMTWHSDVAHLFCYAAPVRAAIVAPIHHGGERGGRGRGRTAPCG